MRPAGSSPSGSLGRSRSLRTFVLIAIGAALTVGGVGGTWAAFRATTTNSGNQAATGTVQLIDNDSGSALFSESGVGPNSIKTKCIQVTSKGSLEATLRMYASGTSGGLAPYTALKITRGTFSGSPTFPSCTGFSADADTYVPGQAAGVTYAGTLDQFPTSWATATPDPRASSPRKWTMDESHAYKIEVAVGDNRTAESKSVSPTFTWETRNTDPTSPYETAVTGTSGLIDFWRLGETSGTQAADQVGSNGGTYTGGYTQGVTGAPANDSNKAVTVNGSTGFINVADANSLDIGTSYSWEAWVKRDAIGGYRPFIGRGFLYFGFNSSNRLELGNQNDGYYASSTATVTDSSWHHVVATQSGTTAKVYLDGADVTASTSPAYSSMTTTTPFYFGRADLPFGGGSEWFSGGIDDVALYNRPLSASEIQAHFNAGS